MNSDILECKAEWSWDEAAVISQRLFADNVIIAAEARVRVWGMPPWSTEIPAMSRSLDAALATLLTSGAPHYNFTPDSWQMDSRLFAILSKLYYCYQPDVKYKIH